MARIKEIGADVVLIDPQFAPEVIAKPEIADMVDIIATVAKQDKVDLFHRYAVMQNWREASGIPFKTFVSSDNLHMNDWGYGCIAKILAKSIAVAASRRSSPRPPSGTKIGGERAPWRASDRPSRGAAIGLDPGLNNAGPECSFAFHASLTPQTTDFSNKPTNHRCSLAAKKSVARMSFFFWLSVG